jgi:hypothetical protein
MITLLTNYYIDNNSLRQSELDYCLFKNLLNRFIYRVVIFHEAGVKLPADDKIISEIIDDRPTYTDYFEYGNKLSGIKILANTDIYFNTSILYCNNIHNSQVYALCRWNKVEYGLEFYDKITSQDCWIWKNDIHVKATFGLGIPGCDNAILYKLHHAGYDILSPSLSIQAIHVHKSEIRNYQAEGGINKYDIREPHLNLKEFY